MRFAIVGAGALGGLLGCMLEESSQDVVLVERNRHHVRSIRRNGIRLVENEELETRHRFDVALSPRLRGPIDVLLIAVKSYDTEEAIRCVRHAIDESTFVGSVQNGLGNLETLEQYVSPKRIFCGSVLFSATNSDPETIHYSGNPGRLRLASLDPAPSERFQSIVAAFEKSRLSIEVAPDCQAMLWNKLVMNAAANPLSALTNTTGSELATDSRLLEIMGLVVDEVASVAAAKGVQVDQSSDPIQPLLGVLHGIGDQRPSMAADFERGAATEIRHINGMIVEEGERLGVSTPINRVLCGLVHYLEERQSQTPPPQLRLRRRESTASSLPHVAAPPAARS